MKTFIEVVLIAVIVVWLSRFLTTWLLVGSLWIGGKVGSLLKIKNNKLLTLISIAGVIFATIYSILMPVWAITFFLYIELNFSWAGSVMQWISIIFWPLLFIGMFFAFIGGLDSSTPFNDKA